MRRGYRCVSFLAPCLVLYIVLTGEVNTSAGRRFLARPGYLTHLRLARAWRDDTEITRVIYDGSTHNDNKALSKADSRYLLSRRGSRGRVGNSTSRLWAGVGHFLRSLDSFFRIVRRCSAGDRSFRHRTKFESRFSKRIFATARVCKPTEPGGCQEAIISSWLRSIFLVAECRPFCVGPV